MKVSEAIMRLKDLQQTDDEERAHGEADDILCEVLTELGHEEVAQEWVKVPKWYG